MEIKEKEEVVQQQYLTFFLTDEEYAINIQRVKEIIEYTTVTKVPKVPEWIRGVINLREMSSRLWTWRCASDLRSGR